MIYMRECGMNLSNIQKAKIYCIKYGHGMYFTNCFGYASCGRCGEHIGDSLAGIFDGAGMALVGHECDTCENAFKSLSDIDQLIFKRLEKGLNLEEALKGIDFD